MERVKKIGTPSEKALELEAYISTKKNGDFVTYEELKRHCKVDVKTPEGRGKFYTACRRLERECLNKPNYGYKLSSTDTALVITNNRVDRVIGGTKRLIRTIDNLAGYHGADMPEQQKAALEATRMGGRAILGKAKSSKKIIRKEQPQLSEVKPAI